MVKIIEEVKNNDEIVEESNIEIVDNEVMECEEDYSTSGHPYIFTEGKQYKYASGNVLFEQMNFYKFKTALNVYLQEKKDKKLNRFFSAYGLLYGERSCIEDAIQKGFQLNYANMRDDLEALFENGDRALIGNIETLRQLSHVKLIENRLLTMFKNEILQEESKGEVALAQAISSTATFIYAMYGTNLSGITDIMCQLTDDNFFVEYQGKLLKKRVELTKEEALTKFLQVPIELVDSMIMVANSFNIDEEKQELIFDSIDNFIQAMAQSNAGYAEQFKQLVSKGMGESNQPYEKTEKKADDFSIM